MRAVGPVSGPPLDDFSAESRVLATDSAKAKAEGRQVPETPLPPPGRRSTDALQVKHVKPVKRPDQQVHTNWWDKAINGAALDAIEFPPVRYLHQATGIEHGVILLAGPPKSGKSMLATGLAVAVAQGGYPFGSRSEVGVTGDVFILSLDDASRRRAQKRLRALNDDRPIPANIRLHTEHNVGRGKDAADNLDAYLTAYPGTVLVVIDTLEHLRPERRPGGASVYSEDVAYLAEIRGVATRHPETSFLCLAHTRKGDDDDPIEAVGGTHGVTGGADSVLVLAGKRGAPRRLLYAVSRDAEDRQVVLTLSGRGFAVTGEDPEDPYLLLTADDRRICEAVAEFPKGASAVDLDTLTGMPPNIGNRLAKLAKDGYLTRLSRGVYAT